MREKFGKRAGNCEMCGDIGGSQLIATDSVPMRRGVIEQKSVLHMHEI